MQSTTQVDEENAETNLSIPSESHPIPGEEVERPRRSSLLFRGTSLLSLSTPPL